ncbi:hypothetical protein [Agrobacterium tumefaciens]|uniref:Uncharacterized protein n=1 Tax=Agrobacterium tumefaciens TaxID=358 RepID=A0AAF0GYP1_AGRTU|nr:hypothetical protein [Agrobacterium tumefaciens]WGM60823.1 hypothetical protein CFBP5506_14100 [Agrobacterium tumefaciens]
MAGHNRNKRQKNERKAEKPFRVVIEEREPKGYDDRCRRDKQEYGKSTETAAGGQDDSCHVKFSQSGFDIVAYYRRVSSRMLPTKNHVQQSMLLTSQPAAFTAHLNESVVRGNQ